MIIVADIGGTNARFGVFDPASNQLSHLQRLACADFASLKEAVAHYLALEKLNITALSACIAGPVHLDEIQLTNNHWVFSKQDIFQHFNLEKLCIVNDFTAQALACPNLPDDALMTLRDGEGPIEAPILVIGPGTGLGVSALVPVGDTLCPLETEGGHVAVAPRSAEETTALLHFHAHDFGMQEAEDFISGAGLTRLYGFACYVGDISEEPLPAAEIVARAAAGDAIASAAVNLFFGFFGGIIADAILTLGARRAVYITGGMIPKMVQLIDRSRFFERLSDQGVFSDYIGNVPIYLNTSDEAGLIGAGLALSNPHLIHRQITA